MAPFMAFSSLSPLPLTLPPFGGEGWWWRRRGVASPRLAVAIRHGIIAALGEEKASRATRSADRCTAAFLRPGLCGLGSVCVGPTTITWCTKRIMGAFTAVFSGLKPFLTLGDLSHPEMASSAIGVYGDLGGLLGFPNLRLRSRS